MIQQRVHGGWGPDPFRRWEAEMIQRGSAVFATCKLCNLKVTRAIGKHLKKIHGVSVETKSELHQYVDGLV